MSASLDQQIDSLREIQGSERDPEGRAFVHLADARRQNGELDEALEILEEGLERHPDFSLELQGNAVWRWRASVRITPTFS